MTLWVQLTRTVCSKNIISQEHPSRKGEGLRKARPPKTAALCACPQGSFVQSWDCPLPAGGTCYTSEQGPGQGEGCMRGTGGRSLPLTPSAHTSRGEGGWSLLVDRAQAEAHGTAGAQSPAGTSRCCSVPCGVIVLPVEEPGLGV